MKKLTTKEINDFKRSNSLRKEELVKKWNTTVEDIKKRYYSKTPKYVSTKRDLIVKGTKYTVK